MARMTNRKERLREAQTPPPWAEVTRLHLPGRPADSDDPGDCLRMATAIAYWIAYEETPEILSGTPAGAEAWKAFAARRGKRWWQSYELAPVSLERWIATVDGLSTPDSYHAVVMRFDELLIDPNDRAPERPPGLRVYDVVRPDDVRMAAALIPADQESLSGDFWRLHHGYKPEQLQREDDHADASD